MILLRKVGIYNNNNYKKRKIGYGRLLLENRLNLSEFIFNLSELIFNLFGKRLNLSGLLIGAIKLKAVYHSQQQINVDNYIYEISILEMQSNDYAKSQKILL